MNEGKRSALKGKTVLITRACLQAAELAHLLRQKGAAPYVSPFIRFAQAENLRPLYAALDRIDDYDMLLFTSVNGVRFFLQAIRERMPMKDQELWQRLLNKNVTAIGPKTAGMLEQEGFQKLFIPRRFKQEEVVQLLLEKLPPGANILFPRAAVVRSHLVQRLKKHGRTVDEAIVYRTLPVEEEKEELQVKLKRRDIDIFTFTSPSTVRAFDRWFNTYLFEPQRMQVLKSVTVGCIGPVTAREANRLGYSVHVQPTEYTLQGLVAALDRYCQNREA